MGHDAHQAAQFLLPSYDPLYAREGCRDVAADIFLPTLIFFYQFFFRKMVVPAAHFRKAQVAAALGVFFQGDGGAGAELIQNITEVWVVQRDFALDNSIIMIQNKTWKFQQGDHLFSRWIISKKKQGSNHKITLAIIERMYYNKGKTDGGNIYAIKYLPGGCDLRLQCQWRYQTLAVSYGR